MIIQGTEYTLPQWNDITIEKFIPLYNFRETLEGKPEIVNVEETFKYLCNPNEEVLNNITIEELAGIADDISRFILSEPKPNTNMLFTVGNKTYSYSQEFSNLSLQEVKLIKQTGYKKYPDDMPDILAILVREIDAQGNRIPLRAADIPNRKQELMRMKWADAINPITFFLTSILPLIVSLDNPDTQNESPIHDGNGTKTTP